MSDSAVTENQTNEANAEPVRKLKLSQKLGLGFLFLILVLLFTLLKLPEVRLTNLVQGYVQMGLDPYGIYLSDQGRELSILKGFVYSLHKPTLELADQTRVELDSLVVNPNWSTLLSGQLGVTSSIHQGPSEINLDAAGRGDKINLHLALNQVDFGKMGVFAYAAGLKGSGTISGTVQIEGSLSNPASLEGAIDLKIKKLHLDEQNLMGFQLPNMNVAEGTILIEIHNGKLNMKLVQIGKSSDDVSVNLTGDVTLNRNLNSSILNLRAILGLSENVKKNLSLLDSILGTARMGDGRYAYKLTGTLGAPLPIPDNVK